MTTPSFRQIYEEHFRFVWRSLHRVGVREAEIPDVLQEVFVVVHRKLGEFQGKAKVTTWLFGICLRVASEHRRSLAARREIASDEATLDVRDESTDPTEQMVTQEKRELLYRLVDELPEEQRVVFLLFELEGLSGEAIAELVAAPVGTVRSRLRLAREGFRRSLARARARANACTTEGA